MTTRHEAFRAAASHLRDDAARYGAQIKLPQAEGLTPQQETDNAYNRTVMTVYNRAASVAEKAARLSADGQDARASGVLEDYILKATEVMLSTDKTLVRSVLTDTIRKLAV